MERDQAAAPLAAKAYRIIGDGGMLLMYDIMLLPSMARSPCRRGPGLYQPAARIRPLRSHYLSVVTRPTT